MPAFYSNLFIYFSGLSILFSLCCIASSLGRIMALWILLLLFFEVLVGPSLTETLILALLGELPLVAEHTHQVLGKLLWFDLFFEGCSSLTQLTHCLGSVCFEFIVGFWWLHLLLEFTSFLGHRARGVDTGLFELVECLALLHCIFDIGRLFLKYSLGNG